MKSFFTKRWKLLLLILVLVIIGLWFSIKKHNVEQKDYVLFSSPDQSFSVQHPRNWDVQIVNKWALVATFMTEERKDPSSVRPYINIAKGAVQWKLDEVYTATVEKYKKLFKTMVIVSETSWQINWSDARKLVFDGTIGGRKTRYIVVVMDEKGILYTITAASADTDSAELEMQVNKMLATWQFTN